MEFLPRKFVTFFKPAEIRRFVLNGVVGEVNEFITVFHGKIARAGPDVPF